MARADPVNVSPTAGVVLADGFPNATAKEAIMPQIGEFRREETGFIGNLLTLRLVQDIIIVPAEPSDAENAPDYRVHVFDAMSNEATAEIGAGWKRTGEKAGDYVSLLLDDPTLARPMRANLFQSGDDISAWGLNWSRPPKRNEQD